MEPTTLLTVIAIGVATLFGTTQTLVPFLIARRDKRAKLLAQSEAAKLPVERIKRDGWPMIDNLPDAPRKIVGRDGEIARLAEMVEDVHIAAVTGKRANMAAVRGPGGIGKTELASEYARRNRKTYEGVWTVPAESAATLHDSLAALGAKLGCPPAATPKQSALDALHAVRDRGEPWLILFDNATDQQGIAPYLVAGEHLHCLVTSRHATWQGIASYPVDTLDAEAALALLRQASGDDDKDFIPLLDALDGYPLALVTAGTYFLERPDATAAEYLAAFDKRLKDAVADGSYSPTMREEVPRSVYGSVSLSIERLDDDARGLLSLAAYLSPDDLWLEMIESDVKFSEEASSGAHDWPGFVTRIAEDPARLREALAELERASLVEREGEGDAQRLTLHRLTQAVMRARLATARQADRWADAAARIVNAFTPDQFIEPAQWSRFTRLVPQAQALLPHAPPSRASGRAFGQTGGYLQARGDYPGTIRLLERAAEISVAMNGETSALHAARLNNLAEGHKLNGDLEKAELLYKRAIEIDEAVLGDHPQTATHINNLADLYARREDFAKAEPLFLRAERIDRAALGEDHPLHTTDLSNLGALYDDWAKRSGHADKRERAMEYKTKALATTRQAVGERHPSTAAHLNNLAILHHRMQNWPEAIPTMRRVLAILLDLLGPEHPNTQSGLNSFAAMIAARDGGESAVQAALETLPEEIAAMRAEHVEWAVEKLKDIADRHGVAATDRQAIADAVQAETARLRAEGAPPQKWSWPLTELQGVVFALQQAREWGIDPDA